MVVVSSGKNWKGEACEYHIDDNLHKNLTEVKEVVSKKDFDYVCIVAGLPGMGKSNFAISLCRYFDKNFSLDNIAMSDTEFIEITTKAKPRSAIMLDESFASLNSRISMTSSFLRIINHLQIIRQKNLFIVLCLPNFFDLQKGISIYRSSHLFVVYGEKFGHRGSFAAWGREEKKMLYINGLKYMNYHAVKPNFRGRFVKQKAIDEEAYKEKKMLHLLQQEQQEMHKTTKASRQRDRCVWFMYKVLKVPKKLIMQLTNLPPSTLDYSIQHGVFEDVADYKADNK